MFKKLKEINSRPEPFQFYTADELWANEYTSKQMLDYHLNEAIDVSSRNQSFIERSVEWIVNRFGVSEKTKIADFGCGPGLYTTRFAERGAAVTGVDFSENSLKYAKKIAEEKGLEINYVHTNYLNFETTHRFDLITMIMCDFCALSPEQRKTMISKFASLLKVGGSVLLDVYSLNSFNQAKESAIYELNQLDGFWSPEDYYCFVNTFKYEKEKVTLDKYTIIEKSKTRMVYNWLQYFSVESVSEEFDGNGLKIESFYSNVAGDSFDSEATEFAIVARKR
ncbi:class I SAM-dependent methyltransferase [Desulfopila aestuarii]|uniref:Methyltransferase domain-containing protein n=1 Tax=Desulfopila aestuarii DSM 18488 TaxID=1121416 RepID=A0A1M7YE24_9BACT|nr:class I SAM-dependent methyltransferase [Desulfopila aestuarii]SHO50829.1 Methyltransferase domain-containing protein [Desulfopila aestuarii DSM 18488]